MTNTSTLSPERQALLQAIAHAKGDWTLASLSRALNRNAAYLHQYLHRQSPRRLPEAERHKIAALLTIDEARLQPPTERFGTSEDETIRIPFLDIESAAGHASHIDDFAEATQTNWQFTKEIITQIAPYGQGNLRLIKVRGDSMAPQLEDGDVIMIDLANNTPHQPGTFVLDDGQGLVVKHLELLTPEDEASPQKIRICSMNKAYAPYRRAYQDIRIIGRVIWMARAF